MMILITNTRNGKNDDILITFNRVRCHILASTSKQTMGLTTILNVDKKKKKKNSNTE